MTQAEGSRETAWILSDGKAGHLAMTTGVAAAMGLRTRILEVAPPRLWGLLAPHGPAPPDLHGIWPTSEMHWPEYAFAAGRRTIPYLRAIRRSARGRPFTVAFMDPRVNDAADLIWVPAHDARRGGNVMTTLTSPHGFTWERLVDLREAMPEDIKTLSPPRVTVLLGGPGGGYTYSSADIARLSESLRQIAALGASFLISASRRTPPKLIDAARRATAHAPRIIWDGAGENPYPHFLASADHFVVTADSVNMTGEACATGRPVYVFMPEGGRAKFHAFHDALRQAGATRPLPTQPAALENWRYQPIHAARQIAEEIGRRVHGGDAPPGGRDSAGQKPPVH